MPSSDLLDPVWQTYNVAKDCLKIANRAVSSENLRLISRTGFVGLPVQQAVHDIEASIEAIEDFAITGLWARFERYLVEYSQNIAQTLSTQNSATFADALQEKVGRDIEYWKIDDLLDVFKAIVDPALIGQAKQIKEYRNWIAHRNPNKMPSTQTDANMTYRVLSEILGRIDITTST